MRDDALGAREEDGAGLAARNCITSSDVSTDWGITAEICQHKVVTSPDDRLRHLLFKRVFDDVKKHR